MGLQPDIQALPSEAGNAKAVAARPQSRSQIQLRYSIGDLCLFRVKFDAMVAHEPFDPGAPPLTSISEEAQLPAGVGVMVCNGSLVAGPVARLHKTPSAIRYVRNQTINHYVDLSGTFEDYLKGFSSKTRSTLQRKVKKLGAMAEGTLEVRAYRTPESIDEYHKLARQIAVKTYQENLFGGAIPATPEFAEHMRALARKDDFRGFLLFCKGEPVSYLYLPAEDGTLEYGYLGYDPAFASWSPGTVLLYLAFEQIFKERKFRYFNFTHGEGQTKELFGRGSFRQADVYYFRPTLRNRVAVYGHVAMDSASTTIGTMLDRLGLRARIRRLLRRSIGRKAAAT